jgi:hypothetical protein
VIADSADRVRGRQVNGRADCDGLMGFIPPWQRQSPSERAAQKARKLAVDPDDRFRRLCMTKRHGMFAWMCKHSVGRMLAREAEEQAERQRRNIILARRARVRSDQTDPTIRQIFHAWTPANDGHGGFAPRHGRSAERAP